MVYPSVGRLSKSVAGGTDVTLTTAEARNQILEFTGTLTANINVIVPAAAWEWIVYNGTAEAFTLTVKTASGTGVAVTQGKRALLYAAARTWYMDSPTPPSCRPGRRSPSPTPRALPRMPRWASGSSWAC